MRLHNIQPRPGSKHRAKRLGQGESSGHGKTSGRGGKGQTARSGSSIRPGFEGGQMPLIRRIPKRGFANGMHKKVYAAVNVSKLNTFADDSNVDPSQMAQAGLVNGNWTGVKVLSSGELSRRLHITAHQFSAEARRKIESLGGTCSLVK